MPWKIDPGKSTPTPPSTKLHFVVGGDFFGVTGMAVSNNASHLFPATHTPTTELSLLSWCERGRC